MTVLAPGLVLLLLGGLDAWVYSDAVVRAERGSPVTMRSGPVRLDTPAAWAVACLLLFVLFFPLYLTRRTSS